MPTPDAPGIYDRLHEEDEFEWAEPGARTDYELALGQVILAYNALDYRLSYLLACIDIELKTRTPESMSGPFGTRLDAIDLVRATAPKLAHLYQLDLEHLRELHHHRNMVTHGHYDGHPFDGSHKLYRWKKEGPRSIEGYSTARLVDIRDQLRVVLRTMDSILLWFEFDDLDAEDAGSAQSGL
ncbi:MAG: hypothetical protein A2790_20155 [Phenylobacterium sp. RIFCSPHIGHO2_01_FULL_69_31]|uniref:hypothetical protein n=1 Tax=Phenylobacterium sp. RIFCSPHIGHO2_01_FULL_69_31 TaxID=1801944 RepID=UPI0008D14CBE|nr:hypothetical protein [Phenylobacterium sp. RIFCSPHIGHO2_01_FULL_69_31]OHB26280.1 MAG: hypothetical protein A2790_20155 [Phenylobacterium sp. RIFCSPHIGHO2_01_FULL_69_31]